jgi:hypothetical protein
MWTHVHGGVGNCLKQHYTIESHFFFIFLNILIYSGTIQAVSTPAREMNELKGVI